MGRYRNGQRQTAVNVPKAPTTPRKCLKCSEAFPSTGPGNRICTGCDEQNSKVRGLVGNRKTTDGNGTRKGSAVMGRLG